MNLAGVKGTLANFSPDPLPDLSVSPFVRQSLCPSVSTRFVALSDLDLGCGGGEREEKEGGIGGGQVLDELPLGLSTILGLFLKLNSTRSICLMHETVC